MKRLRWVCHSDHDWWPGSTLGFIWNPTIGLRDGGIEAERVLGIVLVLLEAMLAGRIAACRARLAVVTDVGLVVWEMGIAMALDGIRAGAVVAARGDVTEVVVGDLGTASVLGQRVGRRCAGSRGGRIRVRIVKGAHTVVAVVVHHVRRVAVVSNRR